MKDNRQKNFFDDCQHFLFLRDMNFFTRELRRHCFDHGKVESIELRHKVAALLLDNVFCKSLKMKKTQCNPSSIRD